MDFSNKNVLLLGDSHTVGNYGVDLAAYLTGVGAQVTKVANVGASATDYVGSGKYAAQYNTAIGDSSPFDVAIITLGTNDAAKYGTSQAKTAAAISALANNAAPIVYYVGPPAFSDKIAATYTPDLNTEADAVWQAVSPLFGAAAIDPREATTPFVSDTNIHFGPAGYQAWADYVWGVLSAPSAVGVTQAPDGSGTLVPAGGGGSGLLIFGAAAAVGLFLWFRGRR